MAGIEIDRRRAMRGLGSLPAAGLALASTAGAGRSATEFGADPSGRQDALPALIAARDLCVSTGQLLLLPSGTYRLSAPLELGFPRLHVAGVGRVVLQADFSGQCVVSVTAPDEGIVYQSSLRNLVLRGNGSRNQDGLRVRSAVHGHRADIRVRNVTGRAFAVESDVYSVYERLVSDFQHDGLDNEARPLVDLFVGGTSRWGATTACTFRDCIFEEGREAGVELAGAEYCLFEGGGAEGLGGWGVRLSTQSRRNRFVNFYCEDNGRGGFEIGGRRNSFVQCEAYDGRSATTHFHVLAGASGNVIEACGSVSGTQALTNVKIEETARGTVLRDCELRVLEDRGLQTVLDNCGIAAADQAMTGARGFGNVPNSNPLLLDWFEEGEFMPVLRVAQGATAIPLADAQGEFQRVGDWVSFALELRVGSVPAGVAGGLAVGGLPYSAASSPSPRPLIAHARARAGESDSAMPVMAALVGNEISLFEVADGRGVIWNSARLRPGTAISVSGRYPV